MRKADRYWCINCFSPDLIKHGGKKVKGETIQQYKCKSCGNISIYTIDSHSKDFEDIFNQLLQNMGLEIDHNVVRSIRRRINKAESEDIE